tara:strand:+ start:1821 stop:2183 length:363 start_codon:yes stop_codon:yes gene_type:complete
MVSPAFHQNCFETAPELCSLIHQKGCDLEGVEGATPNHSLPQAMSMKSAFLYLLTLSLGIAAVTHSKTLLIEQGPQQAADNEQLVQRTHQLSPVGVVGYRRHRMRPSVAYAPTHWGRWAV